MSPPIDIDQLMNQGLEAAAAAELAESLVPHLENGDAAQCWASMCREVLTPDLPFAIHRTLFEIVSADWPESMGPFPVWQPSAEEVAEANLTVVMKARGFRDFAELHHWSVTDRAAFWRFAIESLGIAFKKTYRQVVDLSSGPAEPRWLTGAVMNIADSCFAADPEKPAILFRSDGNAPLTAISYAELDRQSNRVANGLRTLGYRPGDAIAVDMAMTPEAVTVYLGIVKAGCAVISVADSFTAPEIASRLRIGKAKGIFTCDFILRNEKRLPMYEKVVAAGAPRAVVLPAGEKLDTELRPQDLTWQEFLSDRSEFESVGRDPHDAMNILFSSGTTGDPKAIPWNHSTPIKCAADGWLHQDIRPGDVVAWPTNLGWMMGPWLIFAALVNKATIALYGDLPTSRGFCAFVRDAGVTMLGVVPSLVKAWRHGGAIDGLDWSSIRAFSSTGECSNAEDMHFLMAQAGYKPVIEYCGGTEIGGGYLTGTVVQAAAPATFRTPALGLDIVLTDEDRRIGDAGELFLVPPSIGLSVSLINKDHFEEYYRDTPPGPNGELLRRHGDQVERLPNGYYRALGRADDTMNLGGIKVGSAEIERCLKAVAILDESAAVAIPPPGGGPSLLVIFAVLKQGQASEAEALYRQMRNAIRNGLNPLFKIHDIRIVDQLPRTASGKVMRRVLRSRYLEDLE